MKRKKFLQTIALTPFVIGLINSCKKKVRIAGRITGASSAIGHLLRDKSPQKAIAEKLTKKVVIIGAGISGLSAARHLMNKGIDDFMLLELENYPGGNSSYAANSISAYPQGAHYIPIPNFYLTAYIDFLREHNVITGFDEKGLPVYNEMYLCFDSQERLFINGNWQEGVVPKRGLQPADLQEMERFFGMMNDYRS
ncbi:MAG: FAD-dependent oxidoreductase, partial [Pedobacter sp.]